MHNLLQSYHEVARALTKFKMRIIQTNSSIQQPYIHWVLFLFRNWPFTFQIMPWADREFKQNVRKALRLLRKTGMKLLQDREAQIAGGEMVPEDILTQICRYKSQWRITDLCTKTFEFSLTKLNWTKQIFVSQAITTSFMYWHTVSQISLINFAKEGKWWIKGKLHFASCLWASKG